MDGYVPLPIKIPASVVGDLTKMGALLDIGDDAQELAWRMIERVHTDFSGQPATPYQTVAEALFSKALVTFQSVRCLCHAGFGADALALCASLFENLVNLCWIRQAPVRRARRYIHSEQLDKYDQAQKILSRKRLPKGWRRRYRGYLKNLTPQVSQLRKAFRKSSAFSEKRLRGRAKAVKLDLEYDTLYWSFCGAKHTLPIAPAWFVIEHESEIDVIRGPSVKGVYHAAVNSAQYLLRLSALLQDAFALSAFSANINSTSERLQQAADDVRRTHPELCR